MDFMSELLRTMKNCDTTWVIVDRLAKSAHFILMRLDYPLERLEKLYIKRIVSSHGIPSSIVSDRDLRFTSRFMESFKMDLYMKLHLSSAYHPQIDGRIERIIQSLEDLLRACVLEQGRAWDSFLPLIEFTYNNTFLLSIRMAPLRHCMVEGVGHLCIGMSQESVL